MIRGTGLGLLVLGIVTEAWGGAPHAIPLRFEAPGGQPASEASFVCRAAGHTAYLRPDRAIFAADGAVVRMSLLGSNPSAQAVGLEPLESVANYLVGPDETRWRSGVSGFARVEFREVYPGVNLVYYGTEGRLEYDFVLSPGADPAQIRLRFDGAREMRVDSEGDLILPTAQGEFRHTQAQMYQIRQGRRRTVAGRLVLRGSDEIVFDIRQYDRTLPLVIDPAIVYSTYLGGSGQDVSNAIVLDSAGNTYVAGWTESLDFLGIVGPGLGAGRGVKAYVAKFNSAGKLAYITYLGGSREDRAFGIAVDKTGSVILTGWTYSPDFPVSNAAQVKFGGGRDGFVAKLNAAGNALLFGTFLGGSGYDSGNAIAVDQQGNAYVAGETASVDFPTLNPAQNQNGGAQDAFVAKFSSTGVRQYATYLGGVYDDRAAAIAVDGSSNAYVTGGTFSPNFPLVGPFQSKPGGGQDAFVTKLNAAGSAFLYSTYLGGSGGVLGAPETGTGIAVDGAGSAYVAGNTSSPNFPTSNPFRSLLSGAADAFIVKLNTAGSALVYGTYLGGSSLDFATGIAVDASGAAHITGYTASTDFPVLGAVQSSKAGDYDAFLAKLAPLGNSLQMATYFGGKGSDSANAIALDPAGSIYLAGQTQSTDFPSVGAVQIYRLGAMSAFLTRLSSSVVNPQLVSPAPGAVLSTPTVTFTWNAVAGVQDYWIDVGTAPAQGNIASGYTGGATSLTVNLTDYMNGRAIYVQLYSKFPGINLVAGTGSQFQFTTAATQAVNPQLVSPAAGTVLSTPTVTFTWNAVTGVQDYWIDVGTAPVQGNIASGYTGGATSLTVNLTDYMNGRAIYVQLYSKFSGINLVAGTGSQFHFTTAATQQAVNPQLVSPAAGTILSTPTVTFTWSAVSGAQDYWVDIGTAPAQGNIASGYTGGATSFTITLTGYTTGQAIYIQLYSKYPGLNLIAGTGSKYQFTIGGSQPRNPQLISPAAGAVLSTATVTFTWSSVSGAQDYWIDIGTAPAQGNIAAGYTRGATSITVNLAGYINGQPIYIQLYTKFPGVALVAGTGQLFQFATSTKP